MAANVTLLGSPFIPPLLGVVVKLLEEYGYKIALTIKSKVADISVDNRFELPRLDTNDVPKDRNASPK